MSEIIFRYLHFIGIISLGSCLVVQHLNLSYEMTKEQLKKIVFIDIIYLISALITLVAGLVLWLGVGKEASFYSTNWVFHLKLSIFVLILLLSIYPIRYFIKNKNNIGMKVSKLPLMMIRMQLALLFIMPLLGVLIAQG